MVLLVILGVLATISMLLYFPINSRRGEMRRSWIIHHIPFAPAFIVPYLGLFPFITFSMLALLLFTPVAMRLYVSLIFGGIVSALIWHVMPTLSLDRPVLNPKDGPFTRLVAWMYSTDPGGNALPSSHTYTALICSYYLTFAYPLHGVLIWLCGATIVGSTLFVKQHHGRDLIAGAALAVAAIGFSYLVLGGLS